MTSYDLRPLDTGEMLDRAFDIYREHFGTLVTIAVVAIGGPTLLSLYVESRGGIEAEPLMGFIAMIIEAIGSLFASGAAVYAISEAYLGRDPAVGTSLGFAGSRAWRLFLAGIAAPIVVFFGMIALIVPGIIAALGYSVLTQVVILEKTDSSMAVLGRSWRLTKGFKGKVFKLAVVLGLAILIGYVGVGLLIALFMPGNLVVIEAVTSVIWVALQPLVACVFTVLYYDLRVRQEAFDLDQLGLAIGTRPG